MDQPIRHSEQIERYLSGRLTAAEEQAFEEAYLADPRLLEAVELTERLRLGFADAAAVQAAPPRPAARAGWLGLVSSPRYGIAASLVAAVALAAASVLFVQNQELGTTGTNVARHTRVLSLVAVRGGAGNANEISAPSAGEWTVLMLDTGFAAYDSFNAALLRAGTNEELLRLNGITASDGMVAFGLSGSALPPGRYEIRLEGERRDSAAGVSDELSRTPLTVVAAR
jgi:hypothetical protein